MYESIFGKGWCCSCGFACRIVCSTTLWIGQLDKKTQQSDVVSLLEEFGQIESINVSLGSIENTYFHLSLAMQHCVLEFNLCFLYIQMIPPRGCAYIVMVHRQDAYTALNKLSRGSYRVNQKPVKVH